MRVAQIAVGVVFLLAAAVFAARTWDTVIMSKIDERARARLRVGMTLQEAQAAMGSPGGEGAGYFMGDPRYWATREYGAKLWQDAYTRVDVSYNGPKGDPRVSYIAITAKERPDLAELWASRIGLALLAVLGVCLIEAALRPRPDADGESIAASA